MIKNALLLIAKKRKLAANIGSIDLKIRVYT
jgi:hypothetical protein